MPNELIGDPARGYFHAEPRREKMEILVVSGFLGAGKTTFIKDLSRKLSKRICVLENEISDSIVDRSILEEDEIEVWDISDGCVCCSMQGSLIGSIVQIENTLRPDLLIIETSGAAMLSRVLKTLKDMARLSIHVLPPLTLVDATTVERHFREMGATFVDQIRNAEVVAVSKLSNSSVIKPRDITEKLAVINPHAKIVENIEAVADVLWDSSNSAQISLVEPVDAEDWETVSLKGVALQGTGSLLGILLGATYGAFGSVVRAKGILPCGDQWLKFDLVAPHFSIECYAGRRESNVVFIGRNCNAHDLRKAFE